MNINHVKLFEINSFFIYYECLIDGGATNDEFIVEYLNLCFEFLELLKELGE